MSKILTFSAANFSATNHSAAKLSAAKHSATKLSAALLFVFLWLILLPGDAVAQTDKGPPRVRNVYIPQDNLETLFGEGNKGTLMTRQEFQELWEKAHGRELPMTPPVDGLITRARYEAALAENELHVTARLQLHKLEAGWQSFDLELGGMAVESAKIDGQPARVGRNANGGLVWSLRDKGKHELVLDLSASLVRTGGDLTAWLQLVRGIASEFVLRLPEGKQVRVNGVEIKSAAADRGEQTFRIPVDKTGQIPLAILDQADASNRQALVFVRSDWKAVVEPAGLRWQVDVNLDVAAQAAGQFRFLLPSAVEVAGVESPELAGWKLADVQGGSSELTVDFRQPFQGQRTVRVQGLAPIQLGKSWQMPTLVVSGAVAHVGDITFEPAATLRLDFTEASGLRRLPALPTAPVATKTPAGPVSPPSTTGPRIRFTYWQEQFKLGLVAHARGRELAAAVASLVELDRTGATLRTSITIEPRYAPLFDVTVELPRDWTVTAVEAAAKPVAWDHAASPATDQPNGTDRQTQSVHFDLSQPLAPGKTITVTLSAELHPANWLEPEGTYFTVGLPEVRVTGTNEVEGTLLVESPREIELRSSDLSQDLEPIPPPRVQTTTDIATALAFRYQDDAKVTGRIEARLKPASLSVETLAYANLGRESLTVYYQADLVLSGGQARTFDFTLPASVGEKIQVTPLNQAVRVIEQQHSAVPDNEQVGDEKLFLWHIVLDRPVMGQLLLAVSFELPLRSKASEEKRSGGVEEKESDDGKSPALTTLHSPLTTHLPVLAFRNVSRQTGYVAVEAAHDQEVEQRVENLREVDPADLPMPLAYQPGRIVAAYQFQRLPFQLNLSGQRRDAQEVLAAVCDSATITSMVSREGTIRHRANYALRSLGVQHLAIQLPAGANLWSVTLDGQPIEVRRTSGKLIVPLPAGGNGPKSDAGQHSVELTYETANSFASSTSPLPPGERGRGEGIPETTGLSRLLPQTVRQIAPIVNMTTLKLNWTVHLPSGMVLVASDGDLRPETELTRPSLVARVRDAIAENSIADLDWKLSLFAGSFVFAGVVWLLAQSQNLLVRAGIVGIVGLVLAMLVLPRIQSARHAAMLTEPKNNLKQIGLAFGNYASEVNVPYAAPAASAPQDSAAFAQSFSRTERNRQTPAPGMDAVARLSEVAKLADVNGDKDLAGMAETAMGGIRGAIAKKSMPAPPPTANMPVPKAAEPELAARPMAEVAEVQDGAVRFNRADPAKTQPAAGPAGAQTLAAGRTMQAARARLSLTMDLDTRGWSGVAFSRHGSEEENGVRKSDELVLRLQDDTFARTLEWLVSAATILVAWLRRRRSVASRAGWAAVWLILPIGLSGLTPLAWTLVLDGLFLGGLCSIAIWLVYALAKRLAQESRRWAPAATTAMLLLTLGSIMTSGAAGSLSPQAAQKQADQPKAKITQAQPKNTPAKRNSQNPESPAPAAQSVTLGPKPFTIYVPYDPKNENPRDSRWVYLPYDEFQRLWKLANPDNVIEPTPGTPAAIADVQYEGRLDGELARFAGRLVLYTFQDKWVRVPLPLGAVALERVELDGQPATLEEKAEGGTRNAERPKPEPGGLAIYVEKAGMHVLDIRFSVPVTRLGATGRVTVPLRPAAAAGLLRLELPEPGLDLQIEGAPGGWRREPGKPETDAKGTKTEDQKTENNNAGGSGNGTQNVEAIKNQKPKIKNEHLALPIGGAGDLTIRWQPRRQDAPANQLVSVDQAVLVDVQDSGIHLRSTFHYRVAQGAVRSLELRVPAGIAVRAVSGNDVADWSVEEEDGEKGRGGDAEKGLRRLVVSLKAETRTGTDLNIDAFMLGQAPLGSVLVRTLEPIGVTRETGRLVLGCSGLFHVRIGGTKNLNQVEREGIKVPASTEALCEMLSAYRYTARPWSLDIAIDRTQPKLTVAGRTALAVTKDRVAMHSVLEPEIGDSPLGSFRFRLPEGLRISRVSVPPGADWFVDRSDRGHTLEIDLEQPTVGKIAVELFATIARDPRDSVFRAPIVSLADAATQTGQLAVYLDDDLEALLAEAAGARSIDPSELTASLRQVGRATPRYAFQYNSLPDGLSFRLSPAASQMSADVATTVSVREGSIAYLSELDIDVRRAARSELQFSTPDWLGADIDVQAGGIRQVRSEFGPAGRRTWTVTLQQPIRGKYQVHLVQVLPLPDDGKIAAAVIEPLDAESIRSFVILENRATAELTETSTTGATSIQLSDVPVPITDELRRRAISAHRVADSATALTWQRHEREQEKAIPASVNLADLITVVDRDGSYRTQAAYVVTNRTQQFLEVGLPSNTQLWAVYVAGQPVRPATMRRAGRDVTLVPLQKISVGDISAQVVLVYSGRLGSKLSRWTKVAPAAPEILGTVPVARTLWTVYTPDDYSSDLIEKDSNMNKVGSGDLVIARDLAVLEEMNELLKVAKFSASQSASREACGNLTIIGDALSAFQRSPAMQSLSTGNFDNRQSWRSPANNTSIARQLELFCCPTDIGQVKGSQNWFFVQQRAQELKNEIDKITLPAAAAHEADRAAAQVQVEQYFKKSPATTEKDFVNRLPFLEESGIVADTSIRETKSKRDSGNKTDEKEERRRKLSSQNVAQVDQLKEKQAQTRAVQSEAEQSPAAFAPQLKLGTTAGVSRVKDVQDGKNLSIAMTEARDSEMYFMGRTEFGPGLATARAGIQSIDISIPLIGQPQHFIKLLGDPKLTLTARHQDVTRWSASGAWAGLCIGLIVALVLTLTRPQATDWLRRGWPWVASLLGTAWWFLLPLGYLGLALLLVGLAILAWRTRITSRRTQPTT